MFELKLPLVKMLAAILRCSFQAAPPSLAPLPCLSVNIPDPRNCVKRCISQSSRGLDLVIWSKPSFSTWRTTSGLRTTTHKPWGSHTGPVHWATAIPHEFSSK